MKKKKKGQKNISKGRKMLRGRESVRMENMILEQGWKR